MIEITSSENRKPAQWYSDELQNMIKYKTKSRFIHNGQKTPQDQNLKTPNKIKSRKRTLKTIYIKSEIEKATRNLRNCILSNRKKQKIIVQPCDINQIYSYQSLTKIRIVKYQMM